MKDQIKDKYGYIDNLTYDNLRIWVKEAQDQLPEEYLEKLWAEMPDRWQAVIDANGMHTKYQYNQQKLNVEVGVDRQGLKTV